jgi:hypothetical protein
MTGRAFIFNNSVLYDKILNYIFGKKTYEAFSKFIKKNFKDP